MLGELGGHAGQALGVVERRLRIVHAARAGHDEQAVVLVVEHSSHLLAPANHSGRAIVAER